jgi:protein-tyrosine kinase
VFAQLGERTLLIDADLRNPSQHRLFGLEPRAGLSSMLAGRAGMEAIREIPGLANLSVLPAGTVPPNPVELLTRPQLPQLLQQASDMFDVVLLDSSASDETADAQIVAVRAGAALIVARQNAARSWRVQGISAQVTDARATVVGAVLNNF